MTTQPDLQTPPSDDATSQQASVDPQATVEPADQVARDRQRLAEAQQKGSLATLGAYVRLSGPGWLQSAITLGGGSLGSALYLGVLAGYGLLWVQLVAIICGVIMLSAIGYVTLSTGQRPFQAINTHINPVLGWAWALATLAANMVWSLPQFNLGTAAVTQNFLRFGPDHPDLFGAQVAIAGTMLLVCVVVVWLYDSGGWGIKLFEGLLKAMIALIVLSFFGVVIYLSLSEDGLPWSRILAGFVPDVNYFTQPAPAFQAKLQGLGQEAQKFWSDRIVATQRDVIISAVATAVGINMTFLLPYSMLARGWDRQFRGLAVFDLSTGMAIPYVLVTSCVVIASATVFYGNLPALDENGENWKISPGLQKQYDKLVDARLSLGNETFANGLKAYQELKKEEQPSEADKGKMEEFLQERQSLVNGLEAAEKEVAVMLAKPDAFDFSRSLKPLTVGQDDRAETSGRSVLANLIFGVGVLGMAVSTIIILMLISGFVICEMLGVEQGGWTHRIGCLAAGIGVLGPFIWSDAAFYLVVPTSVFGLMLLPVAYVTFFLMMNSRSLMGQNRPQGGSLILWNVLMAVAVAFSGFGAIWAIWSRAKWGGLIAAGVFVIATIVAGVMKRSTSDSQPAST